MRDRRKTGYAKGVETRQRLLDVALQAFGEAPFKEVTTRQITAAAGISLPSLKYYFGDKEGLYRACAETIVEGFRSHASGAAGEARKALDEDCAVEIARTTSAVIGALAGLLVGSKASERWAPFISRELRDPGPAFEILFERLWQPGVDVTARLIARILGVPKGDPAARVQALLLISSVLAFQSGRRISLRTMHWSKLGREELGMVLAGLNSQIDAIGISRPA